MRSYQSRHGARIARLGILDGLLAHKGRVGSACSDIGITIVQWKQWLDKGTERIGAPEAHESNGKGGRDHEPAIEYAGIGSAELLLTTASIALAPEEATRDGAETMTGHPAESSAKPPMRQEFR
jgi:hypothetical protein